jgi:hypothetical protein
MQNKQKYSARQIIPPQLTDTDKERFITNSKAHMLFDLAIKLADKGDELTIEVKFEEYKTKHYDTPWLNESRVDMVAWVTTP